MKNVEYILACNDLGVHVCGSEEGPKAIHNRIKNNLNFPFHIIEKENLKKELSKENKSKNLLGVNKFNKKLFEAVYCVLERNNFPLTIGGDHSIAIASSLASLKKYNNLGIIWIDSHADYHNFNTTLSGNLHGLPFAASTGFKDTEQLTSMLSNKFFNPKNAVLVGARDMENEEIENLRAAGITVFTTEDLNINGTDEIISKAIKIASNGTNGIHISFDVDIIDPKIAMGVSVPAKNGINKETAFNIMNVLKENNDKIKSLDIVEYNPTLDSNNLTLEIVAKLIEIYVK